MFCPKVIYRIYFLVKLQQICIVIASVIASHRHLIFDGLFCVFTSSMNDDDDVAERSNLTALIRWHSAKILVLRLILPKVFVTVKL